MDKPNLTVKQITEKYGDLIADLKKEHGEIQAIIIGDKVAFVKKPDRRTLSFASVAGQKDPMKFNEIVLENCFVGGDEEIKSDDSLFLAAASKIVELIEVKEAELVKL